MDIELAKLKKKRKHAPYKGVYKPTNPQKYKGNSDNIIYRSLWEFKLMRRLDLNESVEWWSSEEVVVWYLNPVKKDKNGKSGVKSRYFPDFIVRKKGPNGELNTLMIEVKPAKQTVAPVKPDTKDRRKLRRFITENMTYKVNQAKWAAARAFCAEHNWKFLIMTEKELGIK